MADAFDAYFGAGAGLNEDPQPLINALRGQKSEGDILGMSTIGQVANMGKAQSQRALAAGKRAGGLKMAREAEDRKNTEATEAAETKFANAQIRDAQMNKNAIGLENTRHKNLMSGKQFDVDNRDDTRKSMTMINSKGQKVEAIQDGAIVTDMDGNVLGNDWIEYEAPPSASGKPYAKPSWGERKKIRSGVQLASQSKAAFDSYKRQYGNDRGIPLKGRAESFVASMWPVFATDDMKETGEWWKKVERFHDMMKKHELFGAALSKHEIGSWMKSNINKDSTDEQLAKYVEMMQGIIDTEMKYSYDDSAYNYGQDYADMTHAEYYDNAYADSIGKDAGEKSQGLQDIEATDAEPPAGVVGADLEFWNTLSPEDQAILRADMEKD